MIELEELISGEGSSAVTGLIYKLSQLAQTESKVRILDPTPQSTNIEVGMYKEAIEALFDRLDHIIREKYQTDIVNLDSDTLESIINQISTAFLTRIESDLEDRKEEIKLRLEHLRLLAIRGMKTRSKDSDYTNTIPAYTNKYFDALVGEEFTYEQARREYFLAIDAYNVIQTMVERELRSVYESARVILFIDCYDLISYLFPRNMLARDEHYDWNKILWTTVFATLKDTDNLKICVSPPSALELFYFLKKKAQYIFEDSPNISDADLQDWKVFWRKLSLNMHAYSLTEELVDKASGKIRHLQKLKKLVEEGKIVNASNVFDYSRGDWNKILSSVAREFDMEGAAAFLREHRLRFLRKVRQEDPLSYLQTGLDTFSVDTDISNIVQTIYINQESKGFDRFSFISHGVYIILCTHRNVGFWKAKGQAPVMNSLSALFLSAALRSFDNYQDAKEFYIGTQFAVRNYLSEFVVLLKNSSELENYIKAPLASKHLGDKKLEKTYNLKRAEDYISKYSGFLLPGASAAISTKTEIGPTGATVPEEVLEFAKDKELRRKKGEELLAAARQSFIESGILSPDLVARVYYPPSDSKTVNELLLSLSGYSFSDWDKHRGTAPSKSD